MTNGEYQQLVEFFGGQFAAVGRRVAALEQRVDEGFRDVGERFGEVFDDVHDASRRLERFDGEYCAIVQTLRRIERMLADEQVKPEFLEHCVHDLKHQAAVLLARIREFEQRPRG